MQTVCVAVALAAWLRPLAGSAQQMNPSAADKVGSLAAALPDHRQLLQGSKPSTANSFERPASSAHHTADDNHSADALAWQLDGKWMSTTAAFAFTAPANFYSSLPSNDVSAQSWNSSLVDVIRADLRPGGTTGVRITGDWEMYGQKREAGATGQPRSESFTMEWEFFQLLPSKLGALELAAGAYQQKLVANPSFPNGPVTNVLPGYSAFSHGFESSLTMPDRNVVLLFRYGSETLRPGPDKARAFSFELSWTW